MEKENINKLKTSLIYKMSLGSKELYHSNIWAWLIEQDSAFIQAFFPLSSIPQGASFERVAREEGNRDLSIWFALPDKSYKCLVIENKLKSIPYDKQLEDYTKGLKNYFAEGVLTGLRRPNIVDEIGIKRIQGKVWRFVSYSEISDRIRKIAKESRAQAVVQNLNAILEYVDNNECVERVVNSEIMPNKLEQNWDSQLNDLGLSDLINKIIGSEFVHYVNERFCQDGITEIPFFFTAEGFHNKKITLDFRLDNWMDYQAGKYTFLKLGIQIEGYQYRRMVDRAGGFCKPEEIFQEFAAKGFFDSHYNPKEKMIRFPNDNGTARPTSMRMLFDKYGDTCVYQYSNLSEDDMNFEAIYQRIKNDIQIASQIMEANNREEYRKQM